MPGSSFYDHTPGELSALVSVARSRREQAILDLASLSLMVRRTVGTLWNPDRGLTVHSLAGLPEPPRKEQSADEWAALLSRISTKVAH